jgi:hypothetical protein
LEFRISYLKFCISYLQILPSYSFLPPSFFVPFQFTNYVRYYNRRVKGFAVEKYDHKSVNKESFTAKGIYGKRLVYACDYPKKPTCHICHVCHHPYNAFVVSSIAYLASDISCHSPVPVT